MLQIHSFKYVQLRITSIVLHQNVSVTFVTFIRAFYNKNKINIELLLLLLLLLL
jgi:hypothetical protein